jgi:hypothetical protein
MLQWLYAYVSSICFKCFICFFRRMLQEFLFGYCVCFIHMFASVFVRTLHMFCNDFFKCFRCFHKCFRSISVAKVSSECFKSRLCVVHIVMWRTYHSHLLQLLGCHACVWEPEGWSVARLRACSSRGRLSERPGASAALVVKNCWSNYW